MGDSYQTIAFPDAPRDQAEALAERARDWMIERNVIVADATDCTLGDPGHRPGSGYAAAVTEEPVPPELEPHMLDFRTLLTCGVEPVVGRRVFHSGPGFTVHCPTCDADDTENGAWSDAVDEWYSDRGPGSLSCSSCGATEPITTWRFDPTWAFGHVGLTFWNWPPLREDWVRELAEVLGFRGVVVIGHI